MTNQTNSPNPHNLTPYEHTALLYAEKHGIIDYTVSVNTMTYYESYPNEGTFKATVNLDTLKEIREQVK